MKIIKQITKLHKGDALFGLNFAKERMVSMSVPTVTDYYFNFYIIKYTISLGIRV